MKLYNLKKFVGGWVVGNFYPSIIKTKDFEFGVKHYMSGQKDDIHKHIQAQEITIIVSGVFRFNGKKVRKDDVILLDKDVVSKFECLEEGSIACVKTPSVVGDKHIIKKS
jgi:hypothetical protein